MDIIPTLITPWEDIVDLISNGLEQFRTVSVSQQSLHTNLANSFCKSNIFFHLSPLDEWSGEIGVYIHLYLQTLAWGAWMEKYILII